MVMGTLIFLCLQLKQPRRDFLWPFLDLDTDLMIGDFISCLSVGSTRLAERLLLGRIELRELLFDRFWTLWSFLQTCKSFRNCAWATGWSSGMWLCCCRKLPSKVSFELVARYIEVIEFSMRLCSTSSLIERNSSWKEWKSATYDVSIFQIDMLDLSSETTTIRPLNLKMNEPSLEGLLQDLCLLVRLTGWTIGFNRGWWPTDITGTHLKCKELNAFP